MKTQDGEYKKSISHRITQTISYKTGTVISKTVLKRLTGIITLYAFDKDTAILGNFSQYEVCAQVLEGTAIIRVNSKKYVLKQGDVIIIPAYTLYEFAAPQCFKMLSTVIYSGSAE